MSFNSIEETAVQKVRDYLNDLDLEYSYLEHEPTPTSSDSSKIRGTTMEEGVKALIVRGKKSGENYMVCVSSHLQADMKKVKVIVGEAVSFEKPEVLEKKYGLIIGGVPPLGEIFGIKTYYDFKILNQSRASFNCGSQSASVIMPSKEFEQIMKMGEVGGFSK